MERTKTKVEAGTTLWKKIGGASFHANIGGHVRIIKPGQVFAAKPEEIPEGFKDMLIPVDPKHLAEMQLQGEKLAEKNAPKLLYRLQPKGGGWWDVVNEDGKIQNEKALREDDAKKLLDNLS